MFAVTLSTSACERQATTRNGYKQNQIKPLPEDQTPPENPDLVISIFMPFLWTGAGLVLGGRDYSQMRTIFPGIHFASVNNDTPSNITMNHAILSIAGHITVPIGSKSSTPTWNWRRNSTSEIDSSVYGLTKGDMWNQLLTWIVETQPTWKCKLLGDTTRTYYCCVM